MTEGKKRILWSVAAGIGITTILTSTAFMAAGLTNNSRNVTCVFAWQACLTQVFIHTPDNPAHEGSIIDLFAFAVGILLGVPIYSTLAYFLYERTRAWCHTVRT